MKYIWLSCIAILWSLPAFALTPLVADLSNYRIAIDAGFSGTRLFLFGARNDSGDVVVIVRGPGKDYIVRKKEEMGGIWINRSRVKFFNVPDFYAIASSKPLGDIEQAHIFQQLGIGQDNLLLASASATPQQSNVDQFANAFLRYQLERKLYMSQPTKVDFMGETLFKTVVEFPDSIPPGDYTAEIYLISGGEVAGMQSTPIKVVKSGLDAVLYWCAHVYPALYGSIAVLIALFVGWFASRVFEKI